MRRLSGARRAFLRHHLQRGGLIAYPTESCYGLGCLPQHAPALRRLIRLKKRPADKGLIVILSQFNQLNNIVFRLPETQKKVLCERWNESSTTFLLPAHANTLPCLRGVKHRTVGVRIPHHRGAKNLCRDLNHALVSSSANRARKRPCKSEREVRRRFGKAVEIIGGRIGGYRQPSTIIDWKSGKVLR
ncbi:MAG: L-threonylcarbamoyladenylate synthase [Neisseria sp.]|nr:L-threonylcarbamoyladenylate synthase [Neisseria sp.]